MAAPRLARHLSHKSALALLPPSTITPPIEAVRQTHDKQFARWPPHINLIYPFLASPSEVAENEKTAEQQGDGVQASSDPSPPHLKHEIYSRIHKVTKGIQPFHISLLADPPGAFSHSKRSKTVWLDPSQQKSDPPVTPVHNLQAALQAEFSECGADQRPFTPHLSVGQAKSDVAAQNLSNDIKESISGFLSGSRGSQPVALEWYVDKVYVIERKRFYDRFKIVGVVELGKE
ncbi:hypothetical protein K469DRAFT_706023 [Zopfia rhizophila CBS 207.26]|uniref:LigT-like protein n=1 Tax=Zopfia rhizophila CBS 207.26 TaxID=1314779 RepID=A0A6A6ETN7_9PEZI|nr:hypothetical protein K469DRAFT_706023 [Zopfia rhizophila CBS 207.26]